TGLVRAHLQFYSVGCAILAVGAISTNLVIPYFSGHSEYSDLGPFFVLPFVVLVGHAIIRHRLFDLRLILGRGATFAAVISGGSLAVAAVVTRLGSGHLNDEVSVPITILIVVGVAALFLSLPVAPYVTRAID